MWRLPFLALLLTSFSCSAGGKPQVPCCFIFGDSLSDSGNNNGLATLAKADFLPYGIDFPEGPTGRFTNGRTTVDLIGDYLGLESYIPPFANSSGQEILRGVNYASGSAGILRETGQQVGGRIAMDMQLQNHQATISSIASLQGEDASGYVKGCLYFVYIGSNDYMLNYFNSGTSATPEEFTNDLIGPYSKQLQSLYEYGARRVVLFGLGPLGCLPLFQTTGKCEDNINDAIQGFNSNLKSLVDELNKEFPDAQFIFVNTFSIVSPDLSALDLSVVNVPCCGVGDLYCLPLTIPCGNRNSYAYWDNAHPTEAANRVLASRAYRARDPNDTYPMDISHLVKSMGSGTDGRTVAAASSSGKLMSTCLMLCAIMFITKQKI
ncbi:hypothetical protein Nepgr_007030 [Nepenthes gracilis]|uniref:GDSL esterase/lipase n=1 Tax=Nepenthes gracilis TaxID=150966 RepID=A0AAD3XHZ8_NEPGR|nr:hypothetical protein Nepgr_007030 [Nepenthes gracilis]